MVLGVLACLFVHGVACHVVVVRHEQQCVFNVFLFVVAVVIRIVSLLGCVCLLWLCVYEATVFPGAFPFICKIEADVCLGVVVVFAIFGVVSPVVVVVVSMFSTTSPSVSSTATAVVVVSLKAGMVRSRQCVVSSMFP